MNDVSPISVSEESGASAPTLLPFVAPVPSAEPAMSVVLNDVRGIVTRVISQARSAGRDYVDQCRLAAEAVVVVRPDLCVQETLKAIFRMREMEQGEEATQNAA